VLNGAVELLDNGHAMVASQRENGVTAYTLTNGTCECPDFARAPKGQCKHRLARGIAVRARKLATELGQAESTVTLVPEDLAGDLDAEPVPATPPVSIPPQFLATIQGKPFVTTYFTPFHVARLFATLDHLSGGRVAWNVVTSLNDAEAQNFGHQKHASHDARYDQADEFMHVVYGLWDTWEAEAILLDKAHGQFADPAKVHRLDYQGQWFSSRGPLTVPRPPQGYPVVIQAGQSPRGRQFAARWEELIFVIFPTVETCKAFYTDIKARAASCGRPPEAIKVAPAVYVVVGETEQMAQEKLAVIERLAHPLDSLVLLSEVFNYDFARHALDDPLSDEVLSSMTGLRGFLDRILQRSGKRNPTVRDFVHYSGRGTIRELPVFVGTPTQVADQMEAWFSGQACDGFVIAATHMPGAYEDVVRLVVPELQRRGLFHTDYTGHTLRDNLGLPPPQWRAPG
jgi:FMN-dependent oxidoreductase (nitrilotriacetate monooxygenase family)